MTHVLLICDTERVQRVFEALEQKGTLKLRTASTLNQADQELSAGTPDFTFVQSRISGFSSEILLRHLKKHLPAEARIVLLAAEGELSEPSHGQLTLDLALDDDLLAETVGEVLSGSYTPRKPAVAEPPAPPVPEAQVAAPEPPAVEPLQPEFVPDPPVLPVRDDLGAVPPEEPALPESAPQAPPKSGVKEPDQAPDAADSFDDLMRRAAFRADSTAFGEQQGEDWLRTAKPEPGAQPGAQPGEAARAGHDGAIITGVPLAEAMRHVQKKKKRSFLLPALAVVLVVSVPVLSYLAGKKEAPPEPALAPKGQPRPVKKASPPPQTAPATPAPPAAAKTAAAPPPAVSPAPAVKPPVAPTQLATPAATPGPSAKPPEPKPAEPTPTPNPGVKALPPLVSQAKPDPTYAKSHPGWQRYLGTRFEYKLFKEADLYKALQMFGKNGETIPDILFRRILVEFAGSDVYQVRPAGEKGKFDVEQGETSRGVGLTLYRNKSDRHLKALVLYYH